MAWQIQPNFMREVNDLLQFLQLPWHCTCPVKPDGDCFFHGVFAQLQSPEMFEKIHPRARNCKSSLEIRQCVVDWAKANPAFKNIEGFKVIKNWDKYLDDMRKKGEWADQHIICLTAMFLGKNILLATDTNTKERPWNPIELPGDGPFRYPPITLGYLGQRHFEPIVRKTKSGDECLGCGWKGKSLRGHVVQSRKNCRLFYSAEAVEELSRQRRQGSTEQEPQSQNEDLPHSQPSSDDANQVCIGCGFKGSSLLGHLAKTRKNCKVLYNIDSLRAEAKQRRCAKEASRDRQQYYQDKKAHIREQQKDHYQEIREQKKDHYLQNRTNIREKQKDHYQQNRTNIRDQQRRSFQEHRKERRAYKKQYYQTQKSINFANEDERKRHIKFQVDLIDCFSHKCICCHKIMSISGVKPIKVEDLKQKLDKESPGLFEKSIKQPTPPDVFLNGSTYICATCKKWLYQKKKMPKHSALNGLDTDVKHDLTDLESVLVSKNILFLKIHYLPKTRWPAVQDKTVNIPLLDDDLRKTYNAVQAFPRKPDEAGLIPVQLKRKLEYKNKHVEAFVRPDALLDALRDFKQKGHPSYQNIIIKEDGLLEVQDTEDDPDSDFSTTSSEEEVDLHPVNKYQFDLGGETMLTENFPESSVVLNATDKVQHVKRKDDSCSSLPLAPGEGKVPTSLMRDDDWDINAFPHLHPSGRYGLNYQREEKLSPQEYFKQRLLNKDKRWSSNKTFVFAALYYIERQHLERQINVSYRRGKFVQGSLVNMEDIFSVFDNVVGTHRYWQQRRYEVIAKLEQLGAFQFFFTLSCADRRWPQTFVAILRQEGLTINYKPIKEKSTSKYSFQPDEIWVKPTQGPELRLEEYLADRNEHQMIRENVLTLTMSFDRRVHAFLRRIVCAKSSPMKVLHRHYRVEFQLRGAGHIHGVLWTDLDDLEKTFPGLKSIMTKLRISNRLNDQDKKVLENYVDAFISCSLADDDLVDIVKSVQKHNHTHTCFKKGPNCRFGFPKLPSEKTIISQPLDKNDFHSERAYNEAKKKHKDVLSRVKIQLEGLKEEELAETDLDELLKKAEVSHSHYYKALEVSQTGACVILKRRVCEANINNYNPEWLKNWDGNMDLQVCLDFFAITTYITDYYTKSESAMAAELKAAFKRCAGMERKAQMKYLVETFLRTRQMGESEAFYRILPQLHLSESDIKCVFVSTGFPWNRSTFLVKQGKDKLIEDEDEVEQDEPTISRAKSIQLPGREGLFKMAVSVHDKYSARPRSIEHICLAQFATCYEMNRGGKRKDLEDEAEDNDDSPYKSEGAKIVSWDPDLETPLPTIIKLDKALGIMKLRCQPAVLRQHKYKEDLDPHEYFYSQLVLYKPWRLEEEELCAHNLEGCINLFNEMDEDEAGEPQANQRTKIEKTRGGLFPMKNDVEEARAMMEELPDTRTQHIGDSLDPENEKDNEDQADEGIEEAEEHAARNPGNLASEDNHSKGTGESSVYRRVDISNLDEMRQSARQLDEDQRFAFDIIIKYVKQLRASWKSGLPKPKPPLLKIHGGAGCGKSCLINVIACFVEYFMSIFSDKDPEKPAVIKAAPTGKASHGIEGLTYHKAFSVAWGIESFSLSDSARATKQSQLSELTVVILDEMSMLKADALYQIHLRLQEITRSQNSFGGIAMILSGDLMQIPPVMARWIFEEPQNPDFQISYAIEPLWNQFQAIELRHNHRQGNDKVYGDMLNRIRRGRQTPEDIEKLEAKVTDVLPEGALYLYGKNALVNDHNDKELSKIEGSAVVLKAVHVHPNISGWRPPLDDFGTVKDTPFKDELRLKVGARVMLTYNVFSMDGLINGAMGTVVGFARDRGKIVRVLVHLDNKKDGEMTRKKHAAMLELLGFPEATPIGRKCFEYSMGKQAKQHSAKVKVIQFPMTTAWATTIHKSQGENIKSPTPLVADIASVHKKGHGMAYVALGRIQNMDQLHLKSFSPDKIMVSKEAEEEAQKIEQEAINNISKRDQWNQDWKMKNSFILKIASLNIRFVKIRK